MKRGTLTAARLIDQQLKGRGFKSAMLTATYAKCDAWRGCHISQLVECIRSYLARKGHPLVYVWVGELQERGAIHYHMIVWLRKGWSLPKPDKRGWWPHGSTRIEWARSAVGYIAKYASKAHSKAGKEFPKGARICGCGGLDEVGRIERRWWLAPGWLREVVPLISDVRRVVGGWLEKASGELHKSPYYRCARSADWSVMYFCRRAAA